MEERGSEEDARSEGAQACDEDAAMVADRS